MQNRPWESLATGTVWRGWWDMSLPGLAALPLLAARGATDGPTLLVTGGVHGDEYEGPTAIQDVFSALDTTTLRGRVFGLPVLNMSAWESHTRVSPSDSVNLNRVFSSAGDAATSQTAALAQVVFDTFVRACDVLIDLHSGGVALVHLPLIGWYAQENGEAERLARGFDSALHPWMLPNAPGVLSYEALRAGKVALGAEWMGGARLDPVGAAAYERGLRRTLAALGMLPDSEETRLATDTRTPIRGDYQETRQGGLFLPCLALGDRVDRNDILGVLRDTLGNLVEKVKAEREGIVAALPHVPLLRPGDRIAYIG